MAASTYRGGVCLLAMCLSTLAAGWHIVCRGLGTVAKERCSLAQIDRLRLGAASLACRDSSSAAPMICQGSFRQYEAEVALAV